jgi:hypothetical protein
VAALTTVLHSCIHEAFEWPQLYQQYPDFATTYHLLGIGTTITDFHIRDRLLRHLCVLASECENLIWEAHYSRMVGHFVLEKIVVVLHKHFYWPKLRQDINKYMRYFTVSSIANPSINNQCLYTPLPTPENPW